MCEQPAAAFELSEDEAEDHGVWNELAGLYLGFGVNAEWCAIADIFAEEVAGGDGGELGEFGEETLGLGAFADPLGELASVV